MSLLAFFFVPSCCRLFNVDLNIIEPSFPAHVVLGFNQHWDGQLLKIIWFRAAKIVWISQRVAEYWVHRMSGPPQQLGWWIFDSWSIFFPHTWTPDQRSLCWRVFQDLSQGSPEIVQKRLPFSGEAKGDDGGEGPLWSLQMVVSKSIHIYTM